MKGQNIAIIGGAAGGQAIARHYARHGHHVIIGDIQDELGREVAASINEENGSARYQHLDITKPAQAQGFANSIRTQEGTLEHLIIVAGGATPEEFSGLQNLDLNTIQRTLALNLLGPILLTKECINPLAKSSDKNKSILYMGSINPHGAWDLPVYSAAKAGLDGLMFGLANEFTDQHNIRINVLKPGTVPSPRTNKQPKDFEALREGTLLGSFPTHQEIAEAAYAITHSFLHMTQQDLIIDAGQTARTPQFNVSGETQ